MAILNKIRQRSFFLIAIIALALFAFVIQGVIDNPNAFSESQDVIATINGKAINRVDFQQKVKNYQDRIGGRQTATQAMNAIYNQELRNIVLETEFETLGLSVEKDEMRELIKNSFSSYTEFQDENGAFDYTRLNAFIANLKDLGGEAAPLGNFMVNYTSWSDNEQSIAKNAIQQSYYNLIKAGINTTIIEAEADYFGDSKTVDLRYVQIPYSTISDSLVTVKKSEIEAYINKNKDQYKADANTKVVYVEFKEEASQTDENIIKEELLALKFDKIEYNEVSKNTDTIQGFDNSNNIEAFVNSNSDIKYNSNFLRINELPSTLKDTLTQLNLNTYYGPYKEGEFYKLSKLLATKRLPDTVKVRHILIPFVGGQRADASVTKTAEEAKKTADSILTEIISRRAKFLDLLSLSSDKVSNEDEGEIEFAYNAGMAPEFKTFSFDNKKGDIEVVGTSFGYHVIEILEQKSFNDTYQIATVAKKIEPSQQTLDKVFNDMSKFEIAAKKGNFEDVAKEKDLKFKTLTFKELDENISGLGSHREVIRWTFDENTSVGDFKNFPISNFGFIVVKLLERNKEGLMTADAASPLVLSKIKNEKKAAIIRQKITATNVSDIAKNQGQNMRTAVAVNLKNTTLSGAGNEPMVVGTALGLSQGQPSTPIDGERGVYVIEVTKINDATAIDNYTPIINRLANARKNQVQNQVYKALENAAEIEDNRSKTVY